VVSAGGSFDSSHAHATFTTDSLSAAGDVDGDGLDDLFFGYGLFFGSTLAPGGSFGSSGGDVVFLEENVGDLSFYGNPDVAAAGDVDGDGLDDLLVGAMYNDEAGIDAGKVYLLSGATVSAGPTSFGLAGADHTFTGVNPDDSAGSRVSGVGDVDGDGLADILIYNPASSTVYLVLGATVVSGSAHSLSTADVTINEAFFRGGTRGIGDVDGDGRDDLFFLDESEFGPNGYLFFGY
jgi:hypothetical protein